MKMEDDSETSRSTESKLNPIQWDTEKPLIQLEDKLEVEVVKNLATGVNIVDLVKYKGDVCVMKKDQFLDKKMVTVLSKSIKDRMIASHINEVNVLKTLDGSGGAPSLIAATNDAILYSYCGDRVVSDMWIDPLVSNIAIQAILLRIAFKLKEIHDKGVSHNDIKGDNIVVNSENGSVHFIDFGRSTSFGKNSNPVINHYENTMVWIAPEVKRGEKVTAKSDVYSLGDLFLRIIQYRSVDPVICQLAIAAISGYPEDRPTLNEFITILQFVVNYPHTVDTGVYDNVNEHLPNLEENQFEVVHEVTKQDVDTTKFVKKLTEGVFGPIDRVRFRGEVCLRKLLSYPWDRENFFKELQIMKILNGEGGCTKVIAVGGDMFFCTVDGDKTVNEMFTDKKQTPDSLLRILLKIAQGLKKIHQKGISQNDIHRNMILVNSKTGDINFIDFGLSTFMGETLSYREHWNFTNSYWIAPEVRRGEKTTQKSDVYSLGVMLDFIMQNRMDTVKLSDTVKQSLAELRKKSLAKSALDRISLDRFIKLLSEALN